MNEDEAIIEQKASGKESKNPLKAIVLLESKIEVNISKTL